MVRRLCVLISAVVISGFLIAGCGTTRPRTTTSTDLLPGTPATGYPSTVALCKSSIDIATTNQCLGATPARVGDVIRVLRCLR